MLRIADLIFNVETCILDAFIDESTRKIYWGIDINATADNRKFSRWCPHISCEKLLLTSQGDLANWLDLAGKRISWEQRFDSDGEWRASCYVFEHAPIYDSVIDIMSSTPESLKLRWTGRVDINWDKKYSTGLELGIDTEMRFKGIWFGRQNEDLCRQSVSNFFDPDDFLFTVTNNGVSLMIPKTPTLKI